MTQPDHTPTIRLHLPFGFAHDTAVACEKEGEVYDKISVALNKSGATIDATAKDIAELIEEADYRSANMAGEDAEFKRYIGVPAKRLLPRLRETYEQLTGKPYRVRSNPSFSGAFQDSSDGESQKNVAVA